MKKRYDYHSIAVTYIAISIILFCHLLFIIQLHNLSKNTSSSDLSAILVLGGIGFAVCVFAYFDAKKTYIEISEEGILFNSITKKIYAPWATVREIKLLGRIDKIYTDNGSFYIKAVEPAGNPQLSFVELMKTERYKIKDDLLAEIKRKSSNAKVTQSILFRPL